MAKLKETSKIDLEVIGENFKISAAISDANNYYIKEVFPENNWRTNWLSFSLEQIPDIIDVFQAFQGYMEKENG